MDQKVIEAGMFNDDASNSDRNNFLLNLLREVLIELLIFS
jgi:hypothetical protein